AGAGPSLEDRQAFHQPLINGDHRVDGWLARDPDERVTSLPEDAPNSAIVNMNVSTTEIAQGFSRRQSIDSNTNHIWFRRAIFCQATAKPSSKGMLNRGVGGGLVSSSTRERSCKE